MTYQTDKNIEISLKHNILMLHNRTLKQLFTSLNVPGTLKISSGRFKKQSESYSTMVLTLNTRILKPNIHSFLKPQRKHAATNHGTTKLAKRESCFYFSITQYINNIRPLALSVLRMRWTNASQKIHVRRCKTFQNFMCSLEHCTVYNAPKKGLKNIWRFFQNMLFQQNREGKYIN